MPRSYVADSSALVALLSRDDACHEWMAMQAAELPWPWLTCEAVLTEAFYLLGRRGEPGVKELLRREAIVLSFDLARQIEPVLTLMDKYANIPMSLADACLVRMSETVADPMILTTDSDFRIYRRHSRRVVPCLLP